MVRALFIRAFCRRSAVLLGVLAMLAGGAAAEAGGEAERPRAGLVWNRTGLPAVFPLQVKTREGADYFLVLTGADTGEEALAAYIQGGTFFKVLVPPGRYVLRFSSGEDWQGEERLFGPQTTVFELPQPLEFAIRGTGIKAGHMVTLTPEPPGGGMQAEVQNQFICQIAGLEEEDAVLPGQVPQARLSLGGTADGRWSLHLRWRLGLAEPVPGTPDTLWLRRDFVLENPNFPRRWLERHRPAAPQPDSRFHSYSVRSLYCG